MIQQSFSISNINETLDSNGNQYVSSVTWSLSYSDNSTFLVNYSNELFFNEDSCPISNLNQDIIDFITPSINFDYYSDKAKSKFIQESTNVVFSYLIYEMITIPIYENVENFVAQVKWRLHAENNFGYTCDLNGQTTFNQLSQYPYISYYDLKQEDVILWLELAENNEELKDRLSLCIYEKMYPTVVSLPLPW